MLLATQISCTGEVKYNDATGYVKPNEDKVVEPDVVQALSHFSYEYTNHNELLCNLKGVWLGLTVCLHLFNFFVVIDSFC